MTSGYALILPGALVDTGFETRRSLVLLLTSEAAVL